MSIDALYEAIDKVAHALGFDRFALSVEVGLGGDAGTSVLVHSYPASWADIYVGFNLAATDPVRRAGESSLSGFRWSEISQIIPMTPMEQVTFDTGRKHGMVDGFTVPRHLPGMVTGSCTFVTSTDQGLPEEQLIVADSLGAIAIAQASRLSGWRKPVTKARLTDRQRDCVLWAARGKTDWEIAQILGISQDTVIQHLKEARERYDARKRASLILYALFEGLISFSDVFRWRERR
ncbi:MAG: LuxR family transcriptional regulator [Pseudomonadota bacterium]